MINGGNGGWLGFADGEDTGDGEVAGETVSSAGDITTAILVSCLWEVSATGAKVGIN